MFHMDIKFMQDLHNKEFAMKESLAQRASAIIAGLTTLSGLLAFVAVNYKSIGNSSINCLFWLFAIASCMALLWASYYLIWSYRVSPLTDIAKPKEWLSYWKDLQEQAKERKLVSAEEKFTDFLLNQYAEIGEGNIDANFKRGTRLVKSNNAMLTSFALIVLTSFIFYLNNYILSAPEKTLSKEVKEMLGYENALICIPTTNTSDTSDGSEPKPRPVPIPGPSPLPDPGTKKIR